MEACREGEKDKFCIKRQTQKLDERGKKGTGVEHTEKALTPVTIASPWYQSGDTASQRYWRGTGWLRRYQTVGLDHYSRCHHPSVYKSRLNFLQI